MNKLFALGAVGALALGLAVAAPVPADAAGYLKIGDIKGESVDDAHKGEIEILSWSWGETQSGSAAASGMPTGKRQHKPLTITKRVDKASPLLQQAATSGKMIDKMDLTLPKEGGRAEEYVTYELERVYITSYQTGGSAGGDVVPTETISLNYEEIKTSPASPAMIQRNQSDMEMMRERAKRKKD